VVEQPTRVFHHVGFFFALSGGAQPMAADGCFAKVSAADIKGLNE
jgi:hypothetical protein